MHLQVYLIDGKRVYTLKKLDPEGKPTLSAHPARFSPDDKYSRHRVTIKRRFKVLASDKRPKPMHATSIAWQRRGDATDSGNAAAVRTSSNSNGGNDGDRCAAPAPASSSLQQQQQQQLLLSTYTTPMQPLALQLLPPLKWNALQRLNVSNCCTDKGESTLDGTLDWIGYQLFLDGLLPHTRVTRRPSLVHAAAAEGASRDVAATAAAISLLSPPAAPQPCAAQSVLPGAVLAPSELRRLCKERDATVAHMRKHGVQLRRSVQETAITIGCDEAGRGPLAGPVVGAAVCRLPMSSFDNAYERLYDAPEQFQIFDSKSVPESQRDMVFSMVTGHCDFFDIAQTRRFVVHHCGSDAAPGDALTLKRHESFVRMSQLPFKKLLSMQTPYLISYHGANSAGNYLYLWSVGIANHSYIDRMNIFAASMHTMHRSAFAIWHMLTDTRFSYAVAARPRGLSIADYLHERFCRVAQPQHERQPRFARELATLLQRHNGNSSRARSSSSSSSNSSGRKSSSSSKDERDGAADVPPPQLLLKRQPPLVLIDGHAVPEASHAYFTDPAVCGGDVQPIIEGDKRSLSIAAASCLAKVTRDELMQYLDALYPGYHFADNKGYPVELHMRTVLRDGLCPVHRKTFAPCRLAIERQKRRREREQQQQQQQQQRRQRSA